MFKCLSTGAGGGASRSKLFKLISNTAQLEFARFNGTFQLSFSFVKGLTSIRCPCVKTR